MSHKELKNFQDIFARRDFFFMSETANVYQISEIILTSLANSDGNERGYINKINLYMGNLNSFFSWINGESIGDLMKGRKITQEILSKIIAIFNESADKRAAISRGYLRKFNKIFLYGLSLILKGIRTAFKPDLVTTTNIDRDQLERFILDKIEGLGNRYIFNTTGKHAFIRKLRLLDKTELIIAERLLLNPQRARRTPNGWIDFGEKRAPVRILVKPRTMLRDEVYFLFRVSEHEAYVEQLKSTPNRFQFSAA